METRGLPLSSPFYPMGRVVLSVVYVGKKWQSHFISYAFIADVLSISSKLFMWVNFTEYLLPIFYYHIITHIIIYYIF